MYLVLPFISTFQFSQISLNQNFFITLFRFISSFADNQSNFLNFTTFRIFKLESLYLL